MARHQKARAHCHFLIKETAQGICHELFDQLMQDDMLFGLWKKRNPGLTTKQLEAKFVAKMWGKPEALQGARATLATMLNHPIDDVLKNQILDALVLDNSLKFGRVAG